MLFDFNPLIFASTFSVCQVISFKFPNLKFFIKLQENKMYRIHHAIFGGIVALIMAFFQQPILLNVGLGAMSQDIFNHGLKYKRGN